MFSFCCCNCCFVISNNVQNKTVFIKFFTQIHSRCIQILDSIQIFLGHHLIRKVIPDVKIIFLITFLINLHLPNFAREFMIIFRNISSRWWLVIIQIQSKDPSISLRLQKIRLLQILLNIF